MRLRLGPSVLMLAAMVSVALAADKPEMVPLKIELPKPAYVCTPKGIRPAGFPVEELARAPRPLMNVPKGTELLSRGKKVTASDDEPIIGKLERVTDGDKDGFDGRWVELVPGLQWVQIDLEQEAALQAIVVWHYHRDLRAFKCVVVQISNDPEFKKDVTTLFNSDQKNDAGLGVGKDKGYWETHEGKLIDAKGTGARYVRLYSNGNTADDNNQYTEVEVWGILKEKLENKQPETLPAKPELVPLKIVLPKPVYR